MFSTSLTCSGTNNCAYLSMAKKSVLILFKKNKNALKKPHAYIRYPQSEKYCTELRILAEKDHRTLRSY